MALTDILTGVVNAGRAIRTSRAADVVAVTSGFAPLFSDARPLQATVTEYADLMEHPLETGAVIADHIVFQPIEIELPLLCIGETALRSTYATIRAAFLSGAILTVQTRTTTYGNMVIAEIPHDETSDILDGVSIRMLLREAKFVTPQSGGLASDQTANANQASTQARGAQQTTASSSSAAASSYSTSGAGPTPTPQGSTLYQWYQGT